MKCNNQEYIPRDQRVPSTEELTAALDGLEAEHKRAGLELSELSLYQIVGELAINRGRNPKHMQDVGAQRLHIDRLVLELLSDITRNTKLYDEWQIKLKAKITHIINVGLNPVPPGEWLNPNSWDPAQQTE
jgi:hypothetical protein